MCNNFNVLLCLVVLAVSIQSSISQDVPCRRLKLTNTNSFLQPLESLVFESKALYNLCFGKEAYKSTEFLQNSGSLPGGYYSIFLFNQTKWWISRRDCQDDEGDGVGFVYAFAENPHDITADWNLKSQDGTFNSKKDFRVICADTLPTTAYQTTTAIGDQTTAAIEYQTTAANLLEASTNDVTVEPEVACSSLSPAYGPIAGGTDVVIKGDNLPLIIQDILLGDDIILPVIDSTAINITSVTPDVETEEQDKPLRVTIRLQNNTTLSCPNVVFTYRVNPSVRSIHPLATIQTGGIALTVNGTSFDSVQTPKMNMTVTVYYMAKSIPPVTKPYVIDCEHDPADSNLLYCVTPNLTWTQTIPDEDTSTSRRRRQATVETSSESTNVTIAIGLIFDGVPDYVDLSQSTNKNLTQYGKVILVSNPSFSDFNQHFTYEYLRQIIIQGHDMDNCAKSEYLVYVGSINCTIEDVFHQHLIFYAPEEAPEGSHDLQVHIGTTLKYTVGSITYPKILQWWVPVVIGVSVAVLVIVVATITVMIIKRRKRKSQTMAILHRSQPFEEDRIEFPEIKNEIDL